ncbi:MAG TPA: cytochrome b562 [Chthoniobacteraceae bacterium]|jgi:soluble cytochrome b562|nr:cytochrome b562 [Chthoniobacteraceae bacterium]
MKIKTLLTVLTAASLGFTAFAADDDTPLSKQMSVVNKSLRLVKRQLGDAAKKDDNLALIGKVKAALDEAQKLEPKKTKDQADKAAYTKKFKEEMGELVKTVGELEAGIKSDSKDKAEAALKKIYEEKEKGHKDFGVDDD